MWGLVASLYLLGFFQRMAPAVMVDELMRDFSISGAVMGNLSATYFYSYAAMQIPSGLLVDKIGPRRLSSYACLVSAIGVLIFAWGPTLWFAYIGRLLVGASVAVAFVTCMKLAGHWFPSNKFATVTGVALLFGNIGGVLAGVPLSEAVAGIGWRTAMAASGCLTLVTAVVIWLFVRDDPGEYGFRSHAHASVLENGNLPAGAALRSVICRRDTWLLFFAGGLSTAPVLVFAGLWGVPYLTQVYGLERTQAATITSTMLIAWAIGGPCLGALSDRIGLRRLPYLIGTVLTTLLWAVFLFVELTTRLHRDDPVARQDESPALHHHRSLAKRRCLYTALWSFFRKTGPDMHPTWPRHEAIWDPVPPDVRYYSSLSGVKNKEKGSISHFL